MTQNAVRVARTRQRQRNGRAVIPVEVSLDDLSQALVDALLLKPNQVDDRQAISRATSRIIEILVLEKNQT